MLSSAERRRPGIDFRGRFFDRPLGRSATRIRRPQIEGLESRELLASSLPNISLLSLSTLDSRSVTVEYALEGSVFTQPIELGIYRSANDQFEPENDQLIGYHVIDPEQERSSIAFAEAAFPSEEVQRVSIALPNGLPQHPTQPYVLAVADPENLLAESVETDNTASFRKQLIGVVIHGGIQSSRSSPPAWAFQLSAALRDAGYDEVITYNWAAESWTPGAAAKQGPRVANIVRKASNRYPESESVDLHLIAHSQGAVVASQALLALGRLSTTPLQSGYEKVTLLDPHAANNNAPGGQYSVSSGLDGWIAKQLIRNYQDRARDPLVVVPEHVHEAEVYYQHTPVSINGANDGVYNLWGQVPVGGQASYCNLTGPGISHSGDTGVQVWYYFNVVPTLSSGSTFVCPTTLTGGRELGASTELTTRSLSMTSDRQPAYSGTASPGVAVRLFAERADESTSALVGQTIADAEGRWKITSRPLPPATYRMSVQAIVPSGMPRPRTHMFPRILLERLRVLPQQMEIKAQEPMRRAI